jgi:hypothetical protein
LKTTVAIVTRVFLYIHDEPIAWGMPTKFLPKRSFQNVPAETFLRIKFLQKRFLAIKFLHPKVPKHKWLPGTNGSQIQMVPRY